VLQGNSFPRAKAQGRRGCSADTRFFRLFLALLASCSCCRPAGGQSAPDEYRVKAAFLFHFAQLVEWPPESFAGGDSFNLCVVGDDPFRGELENSLGGKSIGTRKIRVQHIKQNGEARGCQVVFVGRAEAKRVPGIFEELGSAPIMTVGENEEFLRQGGVIRFCLDENKVRFEINVGAAEKAGIKVSSRLLLLAKNVVGNQGRG